MDAPSGSRHPPQDQADLVDLLSADLRSVTDVLEEILMLGLPRRGRTKDDKETYGQWHEDRWQMVTRARESLALSKQRQ